ncbi:MAG: type II secretion system protein [Phycisphaerae bacterium]
METSHRRCIRAFTLVELLLVIGILALLVAILVPSLSRARSLAYRGVCATHVKEIARACVTYASDGNWHRNTLPTLPIISGISTGNWGDPINGNAACMWLLITGNASGSTMKVAQPWASPGIFVCPEAKGRRGFLEPAIADGHFTPKTVSYAYMSQVPFTMSGKTCYGTSVTEVRSSTIIVADSNPHCTPGETSFDGANSPAVKSKFKNSANHNGEGQNVGRIDGSAEWKTNTLTEGSDPSKSDDFYKSEGSNSAGGVRCKWVGGVDDSINDSFVID